MDADDRDVLAVRSPSIRASTLSRGGTRLFRYSCSASVTSTVRIVYSSRRLPTIGCSALMYRAIRSTAGSITSTSSWGAASVS